MPLAIGDTLIWSGKIENPNDFLYDILIHNLEEVEEYAAIEGRKKIWKS